MQDIIQLLQKSPDAFPSIEIKFCAEECSLNILCEINRSDTVRRATGCVVNGHSD